MKDISLKWAGVVLVFWAVACRTQPAFVPEKAADNNTLLWEISGKNLKTPSYFFGTMHILCQNDAKLSPVMMSLIGQIKQVYFEVDLDDMTQIFGSMNKMKMPKDIVLKNLLTDAEYERVAAYFDKKGKLPFAVIENYKPMLLSAMVQEQAMPCNSVKGMEMLILLETAKRKLDANGLETMSFQTDLFDSIPYKEQAEDLVKTIDSLHSQQTQIDTLIQLYRKQNLTELGKLISESGGAEEKYMNLLVYDRNKKWVSKFDSIAAKGITLFAVGAGHLPGANGVLELLKNEGYTVLPIKN